MNFVISDASLVLNNFLNTFLQNLADTSILELIAVIFGILSVWFAKRENILVYPTGIISVLIYVYILVKPDVQLYADAGINLFYFFMSVYGWIQWTKKDDEKITRKITFASKKEWILHAGVFIFTIPVILVLLYFFKGDDAKYWASGLPYIDSFTTAVFIVAMLFMAFKKVENWIFWILGNIISIPLYIYKGLVFTGFQFVVFLILAIMGYLEWTKKLKQNTDS